MLIIKNAELKDTDILYDMLLDKAEIEGLSEQFTVTKEKLALQIRRAISVIIIAYLNNQAVGMANFHYEDSTFSGDSLIHIKDLYTAPNARGQGIGKALFSFIADLAIEKNYQILIAPVTSNKRPVEWYKKLGAELSYEASILRIHDIKSFKERLHG